jgi:hypothetical protein
VVALLESVRNGTAEETTLQAVTADPQLASAFVQAGPLHALIRPASQQSGILNPLPSSSSSSSPLSSPPPILCRHEFVGGGRPRVQSRDGRDAVPRVWRQSDSEPRVRRLHAAHSGIPSLARVVVFFAHFVSCTDAGLCQPRPGGRPLSLVKGCVTTGPCHGDDTTRALTPIWLSQAPMLQNLVPPVRGAR